MIPILIRNPYTHESIEYEALIDSGADRCVFPAVIGEMIGYDIESGEREDVGILGNLLKEFDFSQEPLPKLALDPNPLGQ